MKTVAALALSVGIAGCALANADMANKTRRSMVGMSREEVASCMGIPASSGKIGGLEVWKYGSGGGSVSSGSSFGSSTTTASGSVFGNIVSGMASTSGSSSFFHSTDARYCVINISFRDAHVEAVNFSGPTGGLLTKGSQCVYALENCIRPQDRPFSQ